MPEHDQQLPNLRSRIVRASREVGKPQPVIEKDYALSYILAGIADVPILRESMVFKGGTCLRKVYFPGYRFSEALDFTLRTKRPHTVPESLKEAVRRAADRLERHGPFTITVDEKVHRDAHPGQQIHCRIHIQFPWMREPHCSVKVEVTVDEPVLIPPTERPLIHPFIGETLEVTIAAYALEEVAAEKLRAFLQTREQLNRRSWVSSRPRDLYDLWYLWRQTEMAVDWDEVARLLPQKAHARQVSYTDQNDFLDERVLAGIARDWDLHLGNFVTDLPSFEQCLETFRILVAAVLRAR